MYASPSAGQEQSPRPSASSMAPCTSAHPLPNLLSPPASLGHPQTQGSRVRPRCNTPAPLWQFSHEPMLSSAWYKTPLSLAAALGARRTQGQGASVTRWHLTPRRAPWQSLPRSPGQSTATSSSGKGQAGPGAGGDGEEKGKVFAGPGCSREQGRGEGHASPRLCHMQGTEPGWRHGAASRATGAEPAPGEGWDAEGGN